ncbi:hypothetical protein [Lunatibacter salilacus]|uniref:hypothetical protein n=1 Tax=Lunatibacter salilacus TaxID=2483804 RepID=UPI00131D1040|nr:hypothetical protein [Lunatibacter salilacus]
MKNIIISLILFISSSAFAQTQVDLFCSGKTYNLSLEKNKEKFTIKIIGFNSKNIFVDLLKTEWDTLSQDTKNDIIISELKKIAINITENAILHESKFEDESKSTVVEFLDTLTYANLNEINTNNLSKELDDAFSKRFSDDCKQDFSLLLERLELKSQITSNENSFKQTLPETLENAFGFAVGLGPSLSNQTIYDYYVSPYDSTLRRDTINSPVFVGSLLVTWNKLINYRRFREGDEKEATGELFRAPTWWGIAVGFNFAEINPSNMQFNLRLSGGLGLLLNLGGGFQMGIFHDLTQTKVLRKDLEENLNKNYPFNDHSNLEPRLFTNQFVSSFSLKAIYKFKSNNVERPGVFENAKQAR